MTIAVETLLGLPMNSEEMESELNEILGAIEYWENCFDMPPIGTINSRLSKVLARLAERADLKEYDGGCFYHA